MWRQRWRHGKNHLGVFLEEQNLEGENCFSVICKPEVNSRKSMSDLAHILGMNRIHMEPELKIPTLGAIFSISHGTAVEQSSGLHSRLCCAFVVQVGGSLHPALGHDPPAL